MLLAVILPRHAPLTPSRGSGLRYIFGVDSPHDEPVAMFQEWRDLLFLHWEVPADLLRPRIPPSLEIDTFDGRAFVGLVPFAMRGVRPVWSPPVPGLSDFLECNVRTYVRRAGHDPGVWFFSLDAANPLAVAVARSLWKLPYHWARMRLDRDGDTVRYETVRRADGARCRVSYAPDPDSAPTASPPGTLEHFLAERYLLYAGDRHRLFRGRVRHSPYPLRRALWSGLDQTLTDAAGIPVQGPPLLAHHAAGVSVDVLSLRPAN